MSNRNPKSHNDETTTDSDQRNVRSVYRDPSGTVVSTNVVSGNAQVGNQTGINWSDFSQQ